MIDAKNICKSFGTLQVLKNVDFSVKAGEVVAIMGASGAGKSTLLQILGTLLTPDAGSLLIDGTNVLSLGSKALSAFRNQRIGFVFQAHHLLPEFTAVENVMIPQLIGGSSNKEADARARELLTLVGLEARFSHKPSELSGGEQQRVAIARALANSPSLFIADEPTGNLDYRTAADVMKILFAINAAGVTVVMSTHNQNIVNSSRQRVIELAGGRLVRDEASGGYFSR